jgi:hypothetical protein
MILVVEDRERICLFLFPDSQASSSCRVVLEVQRFRI